MKVFASFFKKKFFLVTLAGRKRTKELSSTLVRAVQPLVGQGGFEPPTPRLSSVCSNQLSYWPKYHRTAATTYQMTRSNTSLFGSSRGRDMLMAPNLGQT